MAVGIMPLWLGGELPKQWQSIQRCNFLAVWCLFRLQAPVCISTWLHCSQYLSPLLRTRRYLLCLPPGRRSLFSNDCCQAFNQAKEDNVCSPLFCRVPATRPYVCFVFNVCVSSDCYIMIIWDASFIIPSNSFLNVHGKTHDHWSLFFLVFYLLSSFGCWKYIHL